MSDGPEKIVLHRGGWRPVKPGEDPPYDETLYVRADLARTKWRPMETAPHDIRIMVWTSRAVVANYQDFGDRGWYNDDGRPVVPNCWQPLPEGPPQENADG